MTLAEKLAATLRGWIPAKPAAAAPGRRLLVDAQPPEIYAIGDVHGRLDLLEAIEALIDEQSDVSTGAWVVCLGDVIDRGPSSGAVLDHLMRPAAQGLQRFTLMGNHEAMMLEFLAQPRADSRWLLEFGGRETLLSYGVAADRLSPDRLSHRAVEQLVESYVPAEHREFLAGLPLMIETPLTILVHAGLRPGVPVDRQSDHDLLWQGTDFATDFEEFGKRVVHGHTMVESPLVSPFRAAIDTGAYLSGRLSAIRLSADGSAAILSVGRETR